MTNRIKILASALLIGLFAQSCTEEIDLELNDAQPRLVVDGKLTSDTTEHLIILTKTTSYFYDEQAPVISGADLSITDGTNTYQLIENPVGSGKYFTQPGMFGQAGKTYTLNIKNVDIDGDGKNEEYQAVETMKNVFYIDSARAEYANIFGMSGYRIFGFAQEPPTVGDYYMWNYYINGELRSDTLNKVVFNSDELVNGNYMYNLEMAFITDGQPGDTLTIETMAITKEYYDFIISFFIETQWSGGGFGGPPANINTNISNGALGYFNAGAVSRYSLMLP